jgi:hypothetical protein
MFVGQKVFGEKKRTLKTHGLGGSGFLPKDISPNALLLNIIQLLLLKHKPGNAKAGSITVQLTSCLTGLESAV